MGCRLKENPNTIFVAFFEVAAPVGKESGPQIVSHFPADFNEVDVTKELPKFCFPCDLSTYNIAGQFFTFVLTGLDHTQRFGFCRHPPGAAKCLCILSYLPWFDIFYKILNQIAELKIHHQEEICQELITKLYEAEVPKAYQQFQISVPVEGDSPVEIAFQGPDSKSLPRIPNNRNIMEYFNAINPSNMMVLFVSLLYERRILITSDKLSRLTACVHSAASLLYPLYWQHIYIPVMPAHLIDYCCAPMPFLVGVHSSFMPQVRKMALDEVVILNADNNSIETPFDDLQTLPSESVSQLKKNLKNTELCNGDGVARSFLKVLVYLLGGYREAVRVKTGSQLMFDQEIFVQCRSSHLQPFLEKLLQLQHFTQFIDSKVQQIASGKPINDLFEEELEIARQEGSLSSKNLKEQLKIHLTDGKKMLKDAQKNIQQKANPEAMKLKLKQGRDFANKHYSGLKMKLIKGKETEDLGMTRRYNHRQASFLDISLPLPASSAPSSPSGSPQNSPVPIRAALDVRRKTDTNRKISEENARPMTMAGLPRRLSSDSSLPPSLPPKTKSYRLPSVEGRNSLEASGLEGPSSMSLMDDAQVQEVLQKIGSRGTLADSAPKTTTSATDDAPIPMPRRRRANRETPGSKVIGRDIQRPLIPPPPVPPRRERRTAQTVEERLVDISNEEEEQGLDLSQAHGTAVQHALGVDCEDHTLTFQSVHVNNNALAGYQPEGVPRNSSAQTLLADYGLNFGASVAPGSTADPTLSSPTHCLSVPGLRATSSSPNLQSLHRSGSPPQILVQQVLVQQPPASTLPDLLSPTNTMPRQSESLVSVSAAQPVTSATKTPPLNPFQIQHTPLQPMAASGNPFQQPSASDPKDPFADLVSFQRQEVANPSWKK
ncbi:DENN domain-containing protein 1B-like isoform X2 [Acanthaster planci]|uniref:DENN domain-containing protein 1B-like isoform X2 n=1 Tax=Acanthaster planci TaxID=133434 RepID=A0A8B7XWP5_ACAPL|nr:DENN domain-containing protein 1B-like isoform X2 [Acanthaster planci]